jgi:hypothetical protein
MADLADTRVSLAGIRALVGTAATAKSGSTCTATIGDTTVTVQCARDLTVDAGDVLLILRQGSAWWAIQRLYTAAPASTVEDNTAAPPPKPGTVTGSTTIAPVETRSYRSSGWRTDSDNVYQGQYGGWGNHTGCAFYGTKPGTLSGATVTSAKLKVKRVQGGSYAAVTGTLVKITQKTRPAGAPTVTGGSAVTLPAVGKTSTLTVPTAYAQALVDGTVGGLGLYDSSGSPYAVTAGRGAYSAAWTLTIGWSRTT